MLANTRRFGAYPIFLTLSFVYGLATTTIFTVNLLYQFEIARLSPLQLVLVGTVLESSCFLCQVPTGALADLYSRRLSIIIGVVLTGLAFVLEGSFPVFWLIAGSMIFYGVGATFISGAQEAWVADELGEERLDKALLRASQMGQVGNILGALLSVALASLRLNLPVVCGGALLILLGIFLSVFMPEQGFRARPGGERQSWRELSRTFREGLRAAWSNPLLLLILGVGLFYGLASEGYDRLGLPHLQNDFSIPGFGPFAPVVWFGFFSVLGNLLSIGVTELVRRHLKLEHQRVTVRALLLLNGLSMAGLLAFAWAGNFFLAAFANWWVSISRSLKEPIYYAWLARNSPARARATVISFAGQMDALGQIIGGPPVGSIGTIFSLRVALTSVSLILAPILLLYLIALRLIRRSPAARVATEEAATPASL
ncbi:MAG TPA: MFS transporter [Ktedonobacteraceae bacterium]|nr:MFS transporter [Ktedonobacteraceae bacterium]